MNRSYMIAENTAHDKLVELGYKPQGCINNFKLVAVIVNGKIETYIDYQTCLKELS